MAKDLKKFNLHYLNLNLNKIKLLSIGKQSKISDILVNMDFLNLDIETAMKYFFMTFDSSISEENNKRINYNMDLKYESISNRAKSIVNKIIKLFN